MWSVNLDVSISGEYQTLEGHYRWPSMKPGAPKTSLGAPATCLGAPQITVEKSGKNNIVFGNAAGAPGNHRYY
jgi:hypothetical protein